MQATGSDAKRAEAARTVRNITRIFTNLMIKTTRSSICYVAEGCFGKTYCIKTEDGRAYVIKLFKSVDREGTKLTDSMVRSLMEDEARIYNHISRAMKKDAFRSPCMCGWNEYGMLVSASETVCYATMDFRGVGFAQYREMCGGSFSKEAFADSAVAAVDLLAWAHARGIFHLDVKPTNTVFAPDGSITIIDWGNSFILELQGCERLPSRSPGAEDEFEHQPCLWTVSSRIADKRTAIEDGKRLFDRALQNTDEPGKCDESLLVGYTTADYADIDLHALLCILINTTKSMVPEAASRAAVFNRIVGRVRAHDIWKGYQARSSALEAFLQNAGVGRRMGFQPRVLVDDVLGPD